MTAGMHAAAGGDGLSACSGDMLLEALVACAGVTLAAVATALGITLRAATVTAEGDLDFRGTLGVSKDVPVGIKAIRLKFALDTDAGDEQLDNLLRLTERYCVVFQTLKNSPMIEVSRARAGRRSEPGRGEVSQERGSLMASAEDTEPTVRTRCSSIAPSSRLRRPARSSARRASSRSTDEYYELRRAGGLRALRGRFSTPVSGRPAVLRFLKASGFGFAAAVGGAIIIYLFREITGLEAASSRSSPGTWSARR